MANRATRLIALLALTSAAVLPAQEPKAATPKEEASLFPTAVGSTWTYQVVGKKDEWMRDRLMYVTAARQEKLGARDCLVLEAAKDVNVDGKPVRTVVSAEYLAVADGAFLRCRAGNTDLNPPLPFLKAAARAGDTWKAAFESELEDEDEKTKAVTKVKQKAQSEFAVTEEKVTVPAGTYDCTLVRGVTEESGRKTKSAIWYAKGIGPVKQSFDFGSDNVIVLELKEVGIKK